MAKGQISKRVLQEKKSTTNISRAVFSCNTRFEIPFLLSYRRLQTYTGHMSLQIVQQTGL